MSESHFAGDPAPPPVIPTRAAVIEGVAGLVSPPAICVKVLALVKSPKASAADFAKLIANDPNLAARVLRIVNSAYYGFPRQIDTLQAAVTIIGTRDLCNVVVALSAVRTFSKLGAGLVDVETFWRHAVFVALAARRLGRALAMPEPERLFIAGLLHDVGSALLYAHEPTLARWMLAHQGLDERTIERAERQYLGFTHAELGAELLDTWALPPALCAAIGHHHGGPAAGGECTEASVLDMADRLAVGSSAGCLDPQRDPDADSEALAALAADCGLPMTAEQLETLLVEVDTEHADTLRALTS